MVHLANFIRYSFKKDTHASWLCAQRPLTSSKRERERGGREVASVGRAKRGSVGERKERRE